MKLARGNLDPFRAYALRAIFAAAVMFSSTASHAQVRMATIAAHPALWIVHSKTATLYLFGSIHLLPANVDWHTPEIDRAMADADTFVFEAPLDDAGKAQVAEYVRKNGSLPKGATLRGMLPKKALTDYEAALASVHLAPEALDNERPWLAAIVLDVAYLQQLHYVVADGVDQKVFAFAKEHGKSVRCFETPERQLSFFMPKNRKLEIAEFDADLKEFRSEQNTIGAMVDAWAAGDAKTVGRLVNKDLDAEPGIKKLLIDDRNKAWMKTFDALLAGNGTYFITVGAGHLVGRGGIPSLLRAQGYQVEGP